MSKCIKKTITGKVTIKRVSDKLAEQLVKQDGYQYCSKSEWRESDPEYKSRKKDPKKNHDEILEEN